MKHSPVILTMSHGLNARQLTPFVQSFENCAKNARLVVLVGKIDEPASELLTKAGAELVPFRYFSLHMRHLECLFWPLWKRLFPILGSETRRRRLARKVFNLFFLRSVLYLDYIDSMQSKPDWIFLTDCRDVLFQGDIFQEQRAPGLYCFLEGNGRTIAGCPSNSRMLFNCFGNRALDELGLLEPSCAGTVLGDFTSIRSYLQGMTDFAMKIDTMFMIPSDDQGLHNYLVHKGLVPGVRLIGNHLGPVGTLGGVSSAEMSVSEDLLVLQADGRPYSVLHQYDRHKDLALKLLKRLPSPVLPQ